MTMVERGMTIDLDELTGGSRAVELEIGAGKGRFLLARAEACPATMFIAVEIRKKFAGIMAGRAGKRGLLNCLVINDDIRRVYSLWSRRSGMFDSVFIHFPDPWWKRRHEGRDYFTFDFIDEVVRSLKAGGEVFIQTDVFSRAGAILRLLAEHPGLQNLARDGGFVESNPTLQKSAREQACEDLGLPIFRMHFRKKPE
ncbi:MAG: hypothetical protein ABIJ56_22905 [Pseudomonadota bacterium]